MSWNPPRRDGDTIFGLDWLLAAANSEFTQFPKARPAPGFLLPVMRRGGAHPPDGCSASP